MVLREADDLSAIKECPTHLKIGPVERLDRLEGLLESTCLLVHIEFNLTMNAAGISRIEPRGIESLGALYGDCPFQPLFDGGFGQRADKLVDDFAVYEHLHCRNPHDVES